MRLRSLQVFCHICIARGSVLKGQNIDKRLLGFSGDTWRRNDAMEADVGELDCRIPSILWVAQ